MLSENRDRCPKKKTNNYNSENCLSIYHMFFLQ